MQSTLDGELGDPKRLEALIPVANPIGNFAPHHQVFRALELDGAAFGMDARESNAAVCF